MVLHTEICMKHIEKTGEEPGYEAKMEVCAGNLVGLVVLLKCSGQVVGLGTLCSKIELLCYAPML